MIVLKFYLIFNFIFLFYFLNLICAPPVSEKPKLEDPTEEIEEKLGLEYERYMREVVKLLEGDESFRKKLEEVNASEIKSGEIAVHLNFVSHNVRSQLDELKRNELERLRKYFKLQGRLKEKHPGNEAGNAVIESMLGHIDSKNPQSFEIEDLKKLIKKTTSDLEEIDLKRKREFKRYEMEKEHLRRMKMKEMKEEEREKEEENYQKLQQRHKKHPKVHHPGNEEQLKDMWEEKDGLDKQDFDPKTFFYLHDTNGDGFLDSEELEALFQLELDKVYNASDNADDLNERFEEMNLMREHVMNEIDTNKDKMISIEEFLENSKKNEFKKDDEWQPIDNKSVYSEEEMAAFEKEYEAKQLASGRPYTATISSSLSADQASANHPANHPADQTSANHPANHPAGSDENHNAQQHKKHIQDPQHQDHQQQHQQQHADLQGNQQQQQQHQQQQQQHENIEISFQDNQQHPPKQQQHLDQQQQQQQQQNNNKYNNDNNNNINNSNNNNNHLKNVQTNNEPVEQQKKFIYQRRPPTVLPMDQPKGRYNPRDTPPTAYL